MRVATIRAWSWVHKWTSLVCTVFLMMLCITGLPLIFHDEIDAALNPESWAPEQPSAQRISLDEIVTGALALRNKEVPIFMSFDTDRPVVNVTSGPRADAPASRMHFASFDHTSGAPLPVRDAGGTIMDFILQLHTDMFLGLPGMLFLGFMGLLFVASVVSGVVLYVPFMRRLAFGTVRRRQSRRVRWLDYHNFFGIVIIAWLLVVGVTGVINTLEEPIISAWRDQDLQSLVAEKQVDALVTASASLESAVRKAVAAAPDMQLQFVAFPGSAYSTRAHYAIFLHGKTPLTEHIITPILVDARSGEVDGLREMPWYAQALSLSRPLHFGDYGKLWLQLFWAVFDIVTMVILGSGVYLWLGKYKKSAEGNPWPEDNSPEEHTLAT